MYTIEKISETQANIVYPAPVVEPKKEETSIDSLLYTKSSNLNEILSAQEKILALKDEVDEIDLKVQALRDAGLKTADELRVAEQEQKVAQVEQVVSEVQTFKDTPVV